MLVYIVAAGEALFYLASVPLCAAFYLSLGDGLRFGSGLGAFERRFALRRARRNGGAGKGRGGGRLAWRVLGRLRGMGVSLRGSLGLGDAAATALACGALRALGAAMAARAARVEIDVAPLFDAAEPRLELQGMIRARSGQIIAAAARSGIDELNRRIAKWTDTRLKASWPPRWRASGT